MTKKESIDVYFGHADGAMTDTMYTTPTAVIKKPYTLSSFMSLLNIHLLLYERLIVPDAFLLHNPLLRQVLVADDSDPQPYHVFLKNGVIVPALRDTAASFMSLSSQFNIDRAYGHTEAPRINSYAEFLDEITSSRQLIYDAAARQEVMALTVNSLIHDEDFLTRSRLRTLARDVQGAAPTSRQQWRTDILLSRSWFYELRIISGLAAVGERRTGGYSQARSGIFLQLKFWASLPPIPFRLLESHP